MSTEISAMLEVIRRYDTWDGAEEYCDGPGCWVNAGDITIEQDYSIFAVLGNERNSENIPYIGENRYFQDAEGRFRGWSPDGAAEAYYDPCYEFGLVLQDVYSSDFGYSAGYAVLAEMLAYNCDHTYSCRRRMSADSGGKLAEAEPGMVQVMHDSRTEWLDLIARMRRIAQAHGQDDPEKIRLSFYFY